MTRPGTALDRARGLARAYRAALARTAPTAALRIDQAAARAGETWVADPTTGPQACTVRQAAALLGVDPSRVRQLILDGALTSAGKDRAGHVLLVADVLTYRETARRRTG